MKLCNCVKIAYVKKTKYKCYLHTKK
uniref:Uncharacterized protein n=1 Tax=Anguilla anguilla TaxID=7936 RepID=A0A0E9S2B5_ANGAN